MATSFELFATIKNHRIHCRIYHNSMAVNHILPNFHVLVLVIFCNSR